ncbi:MAG: polymer-forming cytoskeletal protein [Veillonellales bacterium]
MFGRKQDAGFSENVATIIGRETEFKGTLTAKGSIRVEGQLEGEVVSSGHLVIGETGMVKANIQAQAAIFAGTVIGNVTASGQLELLPTAKLYGDITVGSLVIGEGALFKGACVMRQENQQQAD